MNRMISISFALLLVVESLAQDYQTDFARIKSTFNSAGKQLAFDVSFRYFSGPKSTVCTDSLTGRYIMQGTHYRYYLAGIEMMRNDRYYIVLNKKDQKLSIENSTQALPPYSFEMIDSIARQGGIVITPLGAKDHLKGYRISALKGDVTSAELWFSAETYRVSKLILQFSRQHIDNTLQDPRVIISYTNYRLEPPSDVFSEKNYVTWEGSQWQPVKAYRSYRLIDHTTITN